ncbi:MAG TPA: GNAT family protein [Mycobacteriales bacterium]|nr:GNAT family protein [Mycobacteriales bacterium]
MTVLRPVTGADVALLEGERGGPDTAGKFGWFGYRDPRGISEMVEQGKTLRDDGGRLVVVDDSGEPVGEVSWRLTLNGPPPYGECWNIGIWIAPDARGKGHGSAAQRLLAEYLFAHTLRERVEAGTELGNVGEQRALENAGFTREGVLRRACFRDGEWRDMVMYSKLRGEE